MQTAACVNVMYSPTESEDDFLLRGSEENAEMERDPGDINITI